MAEGEWESIEAEAGARRADTSTADGLAAAIAIDAIRNGGIISPKAEAYLDEQAALAEYQRRLIKLQIEAFPDDQQTADRAARLKRSSDLLKLVFQLFVALVALAVGAGIALLVYGAVTSRDVVVDAFAAPSILATRGLTGDVVATGVLDGLQKLQDATRGPSAGLKAKNAWSSDIKIEVPDTGVSIGEVEKLLTERFGHDVHISGDLVLTPDNGYALTVRGDDVPAKTFTGPAADFSKLTASAAEYIYGRSEPWLFAVYLVGDGRDADAVAFLPGAYARSKTDDQRADLANVWATALLNLNDAAHAIEKYRLAVSLSPPRSPIWWKAWSNSIRPTRIARGQEAAWQVAVRYLEAAASAPTSEKPESRFLRSALATTWDLPQLLDSQLADAKRNGGAGSSSLAAGPSIADTYALLHDPTQADRYIAASDPDDPETTAEADILQAYAALDRNDAAAAIPPMKAYDKLSTANPILQVDDDSPCLLALAYGLSGRLAEAEAVFKRMGSVYSRCSAFHGDVLAHAGDVAGAQRVWGDGLKVAPDMVHIYLHRGLFELSKGDLRAAQIDLATAHAKAPHYADPLKGLGDLLARAGRWKAAMARYDEALKYAPAWDQLRQARSLAAKHILT